MTLGGKGLCAYNPDMRLYEYAHACRRWGWGYIEPNYIIYVHVAMASRDKVDQLLFESVVSGHHVCKTVWTSYVHGGILTVGPETADRHAVCLMKDDQTVGPVPRTSFPSSWHFLMHRGQEKRPSNFADST